MATPCTSCSKQSLVTSMIPSIFPPITIWWSLSIHCLWNFHWVHVLPYSLSFHSLGHSYFSSTLQPYPLSQCLSLSALPLSTSMKILQSLSFWKKQFWSWYSAVSNFSMNPIALRRTSTILLAFSFCPASLYGTCISSSILIYSFQK